jgi:hypothetical protein
LSKGAYLKLCKSKIREGMREVAHRGAIQREIKRVREREREEKKNTARPLRR